MEGFFSYTNHAQLLAFPIEVVGLTLVVIELFFADKADLIEEKLDYYSVFGNWMDFIGRYSMLIEILVVGIMMVIIYLIVIFVPDGDIQDRIGIIAVLSCSFLVLLVPLFIKSLNRITKGKALGALGFVLTLIGMSCELYQFSDMMINWPF